MQASERRFTWRRARPATIRGSRERRIDWPTSLVGSLLVILAVLLQFLDPPVVESVRLKVFDELQLRAPRPAASARRVVVVDIDDASLHEFGQWPWPRTLLARLVQRLRELGAATIAFDVLFSEADRYSPAVYAGQVDGLSPSLAAALRQLPDNDAILAAAFRQQPVVLGIAGVPQRLQRDAASAAPPPPTIAVLGGDPAPFLPDFADLTPLVPVLAGAASGTGLVTMTPDADGIVRRVPLIARVGDQILPNLVLEALRTTLGEATIIVRAGEHGIDSVLMRGVLIPTERDGRAWIRYRVHELAPAVAAADVLGARVAREAVAGRIVLIGSSAAGLGDIKTVPGGITMPGVQIQAQLLETLIGGDFLRRPTAAAGERVVLLVVGLLLAWLVPLLRAAWLPPLLGAIILVAAAVTWLAFTRAGVLIDGGYLAVALSGLLFWLAMAKFIREESQRRSIRHAFGFYLSPVMVDKLAHSRSGLKLGGERRALTILFSDIRGFTTLSERFADDPEALTHLLNRYLTVMTEVIQAAEGTIDKYIGDAIMAFWNAPLTIQRHAHSACLAALAMRRQLAAFNAEIAAEQAASGHPFEPLRMGVGINTGDCFVGNLGSDQRFNYSVLGDAVNIASRLEGRSKSYGVDIVLGESTCEAVAELATLEIERVRLVGKLQATRIYGLVGDAELARDPGFTALAAAHAAMLDAYRGQDWDRAERQLEACRTAGEEYGLRGLYALYAERIRRWRLSPPGPGWDGSELAESKG